MTNGNILYSVNELALIISLIYISGTVINNTLEIIR